MKKLLAIALVAMMSLGALASCGTPTINPNGAPSESVTDEQNEVVDDNDQNVDEGVKDENNGNTENDENSNGNENVDDNINDENTDNSNTDNGNTDSGNTDSGNTDSGNTDGGNTDADDSGEGDEDTHDHEEEFPATCKTESKCSICGEPFGGLDEGNHEGEEKWDSTNEGHKKVYSCCGAVVEEQTEHTFVNSKCSVCEYECTVHESDGHSCKICKKFVAHTYSNNKCTKCGLERNAKKVTFGSYPQSKVTNSTLISTLNGKVGKPDTNAKAWTSYNYVENANMWYTDIEEGGNKYRGVYFTEYRPSNIRFDATDMVSGAINNNQSANGYTTSNVYWFKYDPITWTIIAEDTSENKILVLCDMIVDAQAYDTEGSDDYYDSTIRKWLNETFINTAFNDLQRDVILTSLVDNKGHAVGDYPNGNNTSIQKATDSNDKIFLLSKGEAKNGEKKDGVPYTFLGDDYIFSNELRKRTATDYAESQGAYADEKFKASNDSDSINQGWWWLRTPSYSSGADTNGTQAHRIKPDGTFHSLAVYQTAAGVVPAMWINI